MSDISKNLTIIIDSHEPKDSCYSFNSSLILTKRKKLRTGDYSLKGYEKKITIERKTLNDYVQTIIHRQKNFKKELQRMKNMDYAIIIVEADWSDLLNKKYNCNAKPSSVMGLTISIIINWQIPIYFLSNRQIAQWFVEKYLLKHWKKFEEYKLECLSQ